MLGGAVLAGDSSIGTGGGETALRRGGGGERTRYGRVKGGETVRLRERVWWNGIGGVDPCVRGRCGGLASGCSTTALI